MVEAYLSRLIISFPNNFSRSAVVRLEYSDNEKSSFEADQQVRCGNKVSGVFEERGQRVSEHIETSGFAVPTSSHTAAMPSVELEAL